MNKLIKVLKDKKFVLTSSFIKSIDKKMNLVDFLVLMYLDNSDYGDFNSKLIAESLGLTEEEVMKSFNNLLIHNLISITSSKDKDGRINEVISTEPIYNLIDVNSSKENKEEIASEIYDAFEKEFGRTLSRTDYELINGWLETGIKEELILGALKEAVYNNTKNFRYIDKIIYEWTKKGFNNMNDVENHLINNEKKETEEYFDYDWLNDDE